MVLVLVGYSFSWSVVGFLFDLAFLTQNWIWMYQKTTPKKKSLRRDIYVID